MFKMIKTLWKRLLSKLILTRVSVPRGIKPISHFQPEQYLGKWYEIARLDNRFEQGLINVYAHYSYRDDNGLKVINRGYNKQKDQWQESIGKAYFLDTPNIAALKVSFFGPFYGGYHVVKIDPNYQVALVVGSTNRYLWILARTPSISDKIKTEYIQMAKSLGFDISKLNFDIQTNEHRAK
ncbi:apolipoprotein D and lipocalin family protein [Orbus hercynius]|uniref:Outer membrane lipoprotein Blc n=1 Tax=Orbus hercynius TaxID=593135 RepID=A0A495RIQ0_9GAMM|nr:lipocalin family protein [Orbus hercynius]RKS87219.1 apolipoprotein D and lipocalin family protein [Orbus hercynius]